MPEFTGSIGANYRVPINGEDAVTLRGSYTYTSKFYTDQLNRDWLAQDGHGLLDASVTFARGERWQVSLWGKNLLNEKDPNFFIDFGANFQRLIAAA